MNPRREIDRFPIAISASERRIVGVEDLVAEMVAFYDRRELSHRIERLLSAKGHGQTYMDVMWLISWLDNSAHPNRVQYTTMRVPKTVCKVIRDLPELGRLFEVVDEKVMRFREEVSQQERDEILSYILTHHRPHVHRYIMPRGDSR